jgi:hypothetical protein
MQFIFNYWFRYFVIFITMSLGGISLNAGGLSLLHLGYEGDVLIIRYSIPYDGVIEIKILNQENRIIWRNQFNKIKGEYGIRIPRSELENAKTYEIMYKGRLQRGKI